MQYTNRENVFAKYWKYKATITEFAHSDTKTIQHLIATTPEILDARTIPEENEFSLSLVKLFFFQSNFQYDRTEEGQRTNT
jgi:hypothetical protein